MYCEEVVADTSGSVPLPAGHQLCLFPVRGATRGPVKLELNGNGSTISQYQPGRVYSREPFSWARIVGTVPGSRWLVQVAQSANERLNDEPLTGVAPVELGYHWSPAGEAISLGTYALQREGVVAAPSAYTGVFDISRARAVQVELVCGRLSGGGGTPSVTLLVNLLDTNVSGDAVAYEQLQLSVNPAPANNRQLLLVGLGAPAELATSSVIQLTRRWRFISVQFLVEETNSDPVTPTDGLRLSLVEYPG